MNLLILDTETSGLDPEENQLLQISAILMSETEGIIKEFNVNIAAQDSVTDLGALKVNKLYKDVEYNKLQKLEFEALNEFLRFLLELPEDVTLVGHNVNFDLSFIKSAFKRYKIKNIEALIGRRHLDTATIGLFLKQRGEIVVEKGSLKELAKALNIEYDEQKAHGARYDALLTSQVYFKMLKLKQEVK